MDFAGIYDRYFPRVYNYVRYHVRLPEDADDVTAKVFEAALDKLGSYDPERGPANVWLFGIARNAVIDWARARSRRGEVPLEELGERAGGEKPAADAAQEKEEAALLLEAVGRLDARVRDIIALKFSAGMTNREIALMTGLSESNIGILIYRAVKKIQADLEGRGKP